VNNLSLHARNNVWTNLDTFTHRPGIKTQYHLLYGDRTSQLFQTTRANKRGIGGQRTITPDSCAHVHSRSNRHLVLIHTVTILSNAAKRRSQHELLCSVAFIVTFENAVDCMQVHVLLSVSDQ